MRAQLYSCFAVLRIGLDILKENESIKTEAFSIHGGIFKTKGVAQRLLAAATGVSISVQETAGEGGAWGIAVLAAFMAKGKGMSLEGYLDSLFSAIPSVILRPQKEDVAGFDMFMTLYIKGLAVEAGQQNPCDPIFNES